MSQQPTPQPLLKLEDILMMPGWLFRKLLLLTLPSSKILAVARIQGALFGRFANKRHRVQRVMAGVLKEAEDSRRIAAICRKYLQYKEEYTFLRVMREPSRFDGSQSSIAGEEHLKAALAEGKGALLLTAHFGFDKTIKPILLAQQYRCTTLGSVVLTTHERLSRLGEFVYFKMLRLPSPYRADAVDISAGINPRPIVEALKRNELVQVALDGRNSLSLVSTPTFGGKQRLAAGPVSVAQRTGAVLLPAFGVDPTTDDALLSVLVMPPLTLFDEAGAPLTAENVLAQWGECYRQVCEAYPHLVDWKRQRALQEGSKSARKAAKAAKAAARAAAE